jgi:hypothetical protein
MKSTTGKPSGQSPGAKLLFDNFCFGLFWFTFYGTGVGTQGFELAKQAPYHLSHTTSPFFSGYFADGGLMNNLAEQ